MNEQIQGTPQGDRARAASAPDHPLIPAGRVSGADVYSALGDKLGKIEDVALDKVGGQVAYAILSFGGFMGLGRDYHPVPWGMLRYDPDRRGYVIGCEKFELENAPSIRREDLSGWDDSLSRDDIYGFYGPFGARPYWTM